MTLPAEVRKAMCRAQCKAQGTAQCAAICRSHFSTSTTNGKCPEAERVWGKQVDNFCSAASALGFVMVRREAIREEREACAQVVDDATKDIEGSVGSGMWTGAFLTSLKYQAIALRQAAHAIRNRPETPG